MLFPYVYTAPKNHHLNYMSNSLFTEEVIFTPWRKIFRWRLIFIDVVKCIVVRSALSARNYSMSVRVCCNVKIIVFIFRHAKFQYTIYHEIHVMDGSGLYSPSGKTSYRQISWSFEAVRLDVLMIMSLWIIGNHLDSAAAELPVLFQSDLKTMNSTLAALKLHVILE